MKSKTAATWLAFLGGGLGLHRFYLFGLRDRIGWLLPIPTLLGLYGIRRVLQNGQDVNLSQIQDGLAWHYKQYAKDQGAVDAAVYAAAEEKARAGRSGL